MKTYPTSLRSALLGVLLFGSTASAPFLIAQSNAAAAPKPDPWIGMWDLNPAKSRLSPSSVPQRDTRIFSPTPDGEKAAWHEVDRNGKASHTACTYAFDGKDYRITGDDSSETLSFTRAGDRALAFVAKKDGKVVRSGTRAVSADGKVMSVTFKITAENGQPSEELWVLDRRIATSAADVLKNAIQYHDPRGKWQEFSGQVRLVTNFGTGQNNGEEIIELKNAEGYYKNTGTLRGEVTVQGVERGVPFRSPGGSAKSADATAKKQGPSDNSIKTRQQHHTAHVAFVMAIAGSGLQLGSAAEQTEFNGRPVHALTFSRAQRVTHPHWDSDFVVYLDRDTFGLCGYKVVSGVFAGNTVVVLGDLDIAGIRVPRAKIYFAANGAYRFTDVFTRP